MDSELNAPSPTNDHPLDVVRERRDPPQVSFSPADRSNGQRGHRIGAGRSVRQEEPARDIYQEAMRALRGRYVLATLLALIGAAAGAYFAYQWKKPLYRAQGLLQIAYTRPAVLQNNDQNTVLPMFDAYLRAQIDIIHSQRLLEQAMQTDPWKATGISPTLQTMKDIDSELVIEHPNQTDHLRISYEHENPQIAAAAVNAIIQAYSKLYESRDDSMVRERIQLLQKEKETTAQQINDLRTKLLALGQGAGPDEIESQYTASVHKSTMLQSQLDDVRLAISVGAIATTAPSTASPADLTYRRIAQSDGTMRDMLQKKSQLSMELDQMINGPQKLGESLPAVVEKRRLIGLMDRQIQQYAEEYQQVQGQVDFLTASLPRTSGEPASQLALLKAREQVLEKMCQQATELVTGWGTKRDQMDQIKQQLARLRIQSDSIDSRLDSLQLEAGLGGRLSIINAGEAPISPYYDPRLKYAAVGAVGGGSLPLALLVLLSLVGGKYRFADEAENHSTATAPMLGMLPALPEKLKDPSLAADAAQSIHHVRVMLQTGTHAKGRGCYMVTSATSGEGKTNLTVALGLSFAASGCKTLVIDCDLVGQGITHGFAAEDTPGLREALETGSARGFVKKLPQGLRLLTAGRATGYNGWTLPTGPTYRMLSEVRRYYDVVLIDTGPILGSVEASVLAPEVDGVILTIASGQQRVLVDRAVQHLASVGVEPAGFVFNRARATEFKYSSHYSSNKMSSRGSVPESRMEDTSEVAAFGPLVRSVASFMRKPVESDLD